MLLLLLVGFSAGASAQQPLGGYAGPLTVAPGQLVTVYVSDFAASAELPARASALPLPRQIQAGDGSVGVISVRGGFNDLLPILKAVRTSPNQVALTVQIPFGSFSSPRPPIWLTAIHSSPGISASALCRHFVSECSGRLWLSVRRSALHVLRSCDGILDQPTSVIPCDALVTRRDGSLITEQAPVRFGEDLTAWAVGLGEPSQSGPLPPPAGARIDGVKVAFGFCDPGAKPPPLDSREVPYAGLVDADVGLYQINFTVPPSTEADPACASEARAPSRLQVAFGRILDDSTDSYDSVLLPFRE